MEITDYDEFAKRMEEKFPKIFVLKYGGFAINQGWWHVIESLCANIQSHIDWKNEQFDKYGRGEEVQQVVVEQIKEKFGGLRFYYQGGDATVAGMVRMAESWADSTCETCGALGTLGGRGWLKTLCTTHREEADALYKERFGEE